MTHDTCSEAIHTRLTPADFAGTCLESFVQPLFVRTPQLHPAHKKVRYYVSYNVLSLRKSCRLIDILSELHFCTVICMQGTRERQVNKLNMHVRTCEHFKVFHCGYTSASNSHAGVSIAINLRHVHEKQIHSFAYPENPLIAGRCMAIRVRTGASDLLHVCWYIPPWGAKGAISIVKSMIAWTSKLFRNLAIRVLPMIYMDSNSQFGLSSDGETLDTTSVGDHNHAKENAMGTLIREFLEQWDLTLVHTHTDLFLHHITPALV